MWNQETVQDFWEHNRSDFAGDQKAKVVVGLTKRYIRPPVLDIGAGSGALLWLLPCEAIGIDIAPRSRGIIQAGIDKLPFSDGALNTVYCTDVLEHLPPDVLCRGVKEVHRVLLPGGHFIATVPNQEHLPASMVRCPHCHSEFHRWGHQRSFSEQDIRDLLCDFREVRVSFMPLGMMAEHWIIRHFWRLFLWVEFCEPSDLLIVARK